VQYKSILAMIFNEIKCHVNTSFRSGGGMHPLHPGPALAGAGPKARLQDFGAGPL